jgi:1-acyl-sn-glycerol-3-phosphate acyltransferase
MGQSVESAVLRDDPWARKAAVIPRPWYLELFRWPLLLILGPVRVCCIIACMLSTTLCVVVAPYVLPHDLTLRDEMVRASVKVTLVALRFLFGLRVRYVDRSSKGGPDANSKPRSILHVIGSGIVVANHIGILDDLAILAELPCSTVAKAELRAVPLVGRICDALRCIWVQRNDPLDRERVKRAIAERGAAGADAHPVLIHSEGTTTNGEFVLQFQKGAFCSGSPVRPIAVELHYKYCTPAWEEGSLLWHLFEMSCLNVYHDMTVHLLDEYQPSEEERADACLYARNVQHLIAKQLDAVPSTRSLYDSPAWRGQYAAATSTAQHPRVRRAVESEQE